MDPIRPVPDLTTISATAANCPKHPPSLLADPGRANTFPRPACSPPCQSLPPGAIPKVAASSPTARRQGHQPIPCPTIQHIAPRADRPINPSLRVDPEKGDDHSPSTDNRSRQPIPHPAKPVLRALRHPCFPIAGGPSDAGAADSAPSSAHLGAPCPVCLPPGQKLGHGWAGLFWHHPAGQAVRTGSPIRTAALSARPFAALIAAILPLSFPTTAPFPDDKRLVAAWLPPVSRKTAPTQPATPGSLQASFPAQAAIM